ncbi:hypothetical protein ACJ41O_005638 [Fusarium nematophilum]
MRPTTLALLALNLCAANAEFWVAKASLSTSVPGPVDPSEGNWEFILPSDARDCGSASSASLYSTRSDVSGDKRGIRVVFAEQNELFERLQPQVAEWNNWNGRHET